MNSLEHLNDNNMIQSSGLTLNPNISTNEYQKRYKDSIENNENFWKEESESLDWIKKPSIIKNCNFEEGKIKWFEDGKLNVSYNCIDRHLKTGDKKAIIWQSEDGDIKELTYKELHEGTCKFANVLKKHNVSKGDRVIIYMPMLIEAIFAMLACTRIGAIHSVVFAGFSSKALSERINDCEAKIIITSDINVRGGKKIDLKSSVDEAIKNCPSIKSTIIANRDSSKISLNKNEFWFDEELETANAECEYESMDSEDPLFILYTSGSTGKPKGILHSSAGYLLYASITHKTVFDLKDDDIYWCTADIGWITGHSYVVYGPLANKSTIFIYEGVPNYPNHKISWELIDKHKISIFYTAPTAIRALMKEGNQNLEDSSRSSLRILGTVGEPINPEAWNWYFNEVGKSKCSIVDTWWQTETGGILISPIPGATDLKAGSATLPLFGIEPEVIDNDGNILNGESFGNLCIKNSWPGQSRSIYNDHQRFIETYFKPFKNKYFSGDGVRRDSDGYYWITGRVDDVINVSGHRLGTAEIESSLVAHKHVSESAVVGIDDAIKGSAIYAYVVLNSGISASDELRKELINFVSKDISPIAKPKHIQFASSLPKTRSGKIMRRILRKIANGEDKDFGDTNTLTNPEIIDELINEKK